MFTSEPNASAVVDGNAALAAQTNTSTSNGNPAPTSNGTATSGPLQGDGSSGASTSSTTGYLDSEGKFTEGWLDRLQGFDDSKQILGQFKDIDGVFKTLVSQQRLLGKKADAVIVPNEKSTPEEWAEFNKRIGLPDSPDKYAARPASVPKDMEWDEGAAKQINATAHKLGITPKQMEALAGEYAKWEMTRSESLAQQEEKQIEEGRKALAEEWGDKFDINISKAKRLVQLGGGDLNDPGLTSPGVVRMLSRIADTLSDDKLVSSDSAATMMVGKTRAFDIMKNPQNPLHQRYASGDREIADLVTDLLKQK
jgi:hypothetical protein